MPLSEQNKQKSIKVYLGLGSNLGNREDNMVKAIEHLGSRIKIHRISSPYETEPVGYKDQPFFLNVVVMGYTGFNPQQLLTFIKKAEKELGRIPSFINGPRKIDIDILFYGDEFIKNENLVIPHPGIMERAFILIPMIEIDADFIHPVVHKTIKNLLDNIEDTSLVTKRKWKPENSNILNLFME
jgi:2-amino-4-hydroxy-6-hydroxymethyldihydropteridine diphosphokinase